MAFTRGIKKNSGISDVFFCFLRNIAEVLEFCNLFMFSPEHFKTLRLKITISKYDIPITIFLDLKNKRKLETSINPSLAEVG